MKFLCQLVSNLDEYDYTQQLRKDLLFNDYIEQDCFRPKNGTKYVKSIEKR
jgi:hypothetical protein